MPSYSEPIGVLRGHLEEILSAVRDAHGYHIADDLARQFKNVGGTHRPSNLARKLEKASDRLEGYLAEEDHDSIPEE